MKLIRIVSVVIGLLAILSFYLSYQLDSLFLFLMATFLLLVAVFVNIGYMVLDLYKKDKEFNIEKLKEQGLTIVQCQTCKIDNVLEDQYCRSCGEKLED